MELEYLKKLNNRLVVIETSLSRMNNLRLYICKAESKLGRCGDSHPAFNEYNEDRKCIDFVINHLLLVKKHYMNLRDELKNSKLIEKIKKLSV